MRPYLCLTLLLIPSMLIFACQGGTPAYPDREPTGGFLRETANIVAGHALYDQHCVRCHGKPEEGGPIEKFDPPAPHFVNDRYAGMDPAYLYWRIEEGKNVEPYLSRGSVMPAWGPYFTEQQIWQLVAYIQKRARR